MRVINVVTMTSGSIDEIKSFVISDDANKNDAERQAIVEKAEAYLLNEANRIGEADDDFDEEDVLDNTYYEYGNNKVQLIWSVVEI